MCKASSVAKGMGRVEAWFSAAEEADKVETRCCLTASKEG